MATELVNRILDELKYVEEQYHRLILIVGLSGSGKTAALRKLSASIALPIINLNLELSKRMLELTERQRILNLREILDSLITDIPSDIVLLDSIEILFDESLKQDPLRLLEGISRNKTLVVAWNGTCAGGYITYAVQGHREYRKYPISGIRVLSINKEKGDK